MIAPQISSHLHGFTIPFPSLSNFHKLRTQRFIYPLPRKKIFRIWNLPSTLSFDKACNSQKNIKPYHNHFPVFGTTSSKAFSLFLFYVSTPVSKCLQKSPSPFPVSRSPFFYLPFSFPISLLSPNINPDIDLYLSSHLPVSDS